MVVQIAKNIFGVDEVIARIYDTERKKIYDQMGIKSICPVSVSADLILTELISVKES